MPELPEVEVLAKHLGPLLKGRRVLRAKVNRARVLRPTSAKSLQAAVKGQRFLGLTRRGKYLVFELIGPDGKTVRLLGHLGMTGRMYLQEKQDRLPKHAAVVFDLDEARFVFEDTRYFGKLTLDTRPLNRLGPEPLEPGWRTSDLQVALLRSRRPIKTLLLDQAVVAGIGNIYASEALFRARIDPRMPANRLDSASTRRLWKAIRRVLREAIRSGSTIPLNYNGSGDNDGIFYFGRTEGASEYHTERLLVYDRQNLPCRVCREPIVRIFQTGRSSYFCPHCQPAWRGRKRPTGR